MPAPQAGRSGSVYIKLFDAKAFETRHPGAGRGLVRQFRAVSVEIPAFRHRRKFILSARPAGSRRAGMTAMSHHHRSLV